jgi:hypothetical protein
LFRVPSSNPVTKFHQRFTRELTEMQVRGLPFYHAWAFATTRQLGSAFEIAAENLKWLLANGERDLTDAITAFESISAACKAFIMKGARAVNSKKALDATSMFDEIERAWDTGITSLHHHFKRA